MARPMVIGFDLDMTLIDSRLGIAATYRALSASTGRFIDVAAAVSRLGPPLDEELARWFPAERVAAAGDEFRALYSRYAIEATPSLPGAHDAFGCVRALGGQVIVITGKYEPNRYSTIMPNVNSSFGRRSGVRKARTKVDSMPP